MKFSRENHAKFKLSSATPHPPNPRTHPRTPASPTPPNPSNRPKSPPSPRVDSGKGGKGGERGGVRVENVFSVFGPLGKSGSDDRLREKGCHGGGGVYFRTIVKPLWQLLPSEAKNPPTQKARKTPEKQLLWQVFSGVSAVFPAVFRLLNCDPLGTRTKNLALKLPKISLTKGYFG